MNGQSIARNIGFILLQDGRIDEAERWIRPTAQTYASWGLVTMSQYQEIIGRFEDAEKWMHAEMQSYPTSGPFGWWACCYRTNHPNLEKAMEMILERYDRYKAAHGIDTATLMNNLTKNYQVLYPCYCMDHPIPKQIGPDPFGQEFLRSGVGIFGFFAWLEAKEKKDVKKAAIILNRMRELWFLDGEKDPFVAAQRTVLPKIQERLYVAYAYQMFAALVQADQETDNPGNLDPAEVGYLLRTHFRHDLDPGMTPWLLYLFGRYYDHCGKKDKALECYRRLLAFRVDFNYYIRCLAVKELRKSGLSDEEYVEYSQGDPEIPYFEVSYSDLDRFCRQHFRDYSASPSESVLARPVAGKPVSATDFGKATAFTPGVYKVTGVLFRGEIIPERNNVVYWWITEKTDEDEGHWSMSGIARIGGFETKREKRRPDGTYPLRLGSLPALASFHGDRVALVVSLKPEEEPDTMEPAPDSNRVRIEMKKVTEIPVYEPVIPTSASAGRESKQAVFGKEMSKSDDAETKKWIARTRVIALGLSSLAILCAVLLSVFGKKRPREIAEQPAE